MILPGLPVAVTPKLLLTLSILAVAAWAARDKIADAVREYSVELTAVVGGLVVGYLFAPRVLGVLPV